MRVLRLKLTTLPAATIIALLAVAGCGGAGAGNGTDDGNGANGGNCDSSTSHTIEWRIDGSYETTSGANVSVATTWISADGNTNATDPNATTFDPSPGTILTETLPGCSSASINITMLDGGSDSAVELTNLTLSIYVDGSLADSVTFTGSYNEGTILPDGGGLVVTF